MLDRVIIRYDLEQFPFPDIVGEHVGSDLTRLHERYRYDRFTLGTEQHTELHALLYAIGDRFFETYRRFVVDVVKPLFGEDLVVQRRPNFRFQLPGNLAVRGYHRDRDNGHLTCEVNCWVPLTPVEETTAVWVETMDGSGDHRPAAVQPGELLLFDGANLEHGNQESSAATTRVSFDFRVVRQSLFRPSNTRSMYRDVPFTLGEYFEVV